MSGAYPRFGVAARSLPVAIGLTLCAVSADAWARARASAPAEIPPPAASVTVAEPPAPGPEPAPAPAPTPSDPAATATVPDASAPAPTEAPPAEPAPPTAAGLAADSLDAPSVATPPSAAATTPAAAATPATAAPSEEEALTPNEAITKAYAPRFRPARDVGRLNVVARLLFANAGGQDSAGGRFGGATVDVGQSWNRFGYAATASVWGGRYVAAPSGNVEINALLGIGPTVGLGRLALLGRGFLDLRAGYDFYYGVVNQRASVELQSTAGSGVAVQPARNVAPHGPRVRLDLGLVSLDDARRFWHGIGLSMGYQALIGSFGAQMPRVHMLTLGLTYWMG
ncbi:MAG: hypothetical protein IPH07_04160 [Deltaproteobacteria bacterium]|nr:hypothetical protein [Deltaproteobacteria bacterium]MBP7289741.1 hypothetical protein [Nannocystaceae bacterium]